MGCLFFQPYSTFFYNHELASSGRFTYLCLAQIKSVFFLISAPWLSSWFWDFEESQDLHQRYLEYFRYFIHCPLHYWLAIKVCSLSCHSRPPQCSLECYLWTILCFRLTTLLFYPGKVVLCIDFVVFCLRLMAIFTISRTLGPKIIIVKRMVRGWHLKNNERSDWCNKF